MGDKAKHRTKQWQRRQIDRLITELAQNTIKEHNFNRLKALGVIKEEK